MNGEPLTLGAEIHGMALGSLQSNGYLIIDPETRETLLVDPGGDSEKVFEWCAALNAQVCMILNTHGHGDHIGANAPVKERFGVPLGIHKDDAEVLGDPMLNLSAYFDPVTSPPPDFLLEPGTNIDWNGPTVKVLLTPGHSPGSVSFLGDGWIVSGDVLFNGGIGRTDFPRCDHARLLQSIREELLTLPDDTIVYPGHGEPTTIGAERETNPFLQSELVREQ